MTPAALLKRQVSPLKETQPGACLLFFSAVQLTLWRPGQVNSQGRCAAAQESAATLW